MFTSSGCYGKVFYLLLLYLTVKCIKVLFRCAIISYLGWQVNEISSPGLVFIAVKPLGL